MKKYELTVVLPESVTSAKKKSLKEKIEKIVKTLDGKVGKEDDWGKVDFAHPVKGKKSGTLITYPLELEKQKINSIPEKLNLEDGILRYLLIEKKEKKKAK